MSIRIVCVDGIKVKMIKPIAEVIQKRAELYLSHIIRESPNELTHQATFKKDIRPNLPHKYRVGRPRLNWTKETLSRLWVKFRSWNEKHEYDENNKKHRKRLLYYINLRID